MSIGGGGSNGNLRWTDLALNDLLPIDEEKEEAQRAIQARKMASGASNNHSQTQQAQTTQVRPENDDDEDDDEDEDNNDDEDDDEGMMEEGEEEDLSDGYEEPWALLVLLVHNTNGQLADIMHQTKEKLPQNCQNLPVVDLSHSLHVR